MAEPKKDLDAEKRLQEYQAELRRKKLLNIAYISGTLVIGVVLVSVLWGRSVSAFVMDTVLHEGAGIYADCSRKENRNVSYCQAKETEDAKLWRSMKKGKQAAFQLYDRK